MSRLIFMFGTFSWWLPYLHGNRKLFSHKESGYVNFHSPNSVPPFPSVHGCLTMSRNQSSCLIETISQALLSSVDRNCLSDWGGHVYVNSSGVMPIIFSTSSLALPGTLARFTG
ncbi:hypothetical protein RIF29_20793 [Crotalaria pallida]|uniref:Uncharacterized protein n=1 Tax=Crotalaria pallida TaxID=3830 RepID=A0AAN9ICS4_CROPI